MFGKTLLISGGRVDLEFAKEYVSAQTYDTVVCADSGLEAAYALELSVNYIMGDFDSVSPEILQKYQEKKVAGSLAAEFVQYPTAKDATDTHMVLEWLTEQYPSEITILGATGGRMDHLLANINILMKPLSYGIPAYIIDPNNRLYLADHSLVLHREKLFGKYISLQPLTEKVYPVTLRGFEYGLEEYTLTIGDSRGVSNELRKDAEAACITFQEGILIIIESRD